MGKYNERKKEYDMQYLKENYRRINFSIPRSYFDTVLKPVFERSGIPMNEFIRRALEEKINRDFPDAVARNRFCLIRSTGYYLLVAYDGNTAKWKQIDSAPAALDPKTDTSSWDSEEVADFNEFFGIGNGSEILAEAAI